MPIKDSLIAATALVHDLTIATRNADAAKREWAQLEPVANAVSFARDLVNEPPNVLSPVEFANRGRYPRAALRCHVRQA